MAVIAKNYLDLTGLQAYDALLKAWANSADQKGYKTILKSADGNTLNLYKKANAVLGTDEPDATVSLGGGDMQSQLDALASIAGATWVPAAGDVAGHYTIDLDSTFAQATVDIVDALNELKGQINTLNGSDSISGSVAKSIKDAIEDLDVTEFATAEVNNNVVTIHGIKEVDGEIAVGDTTSNDVVLEEVAYTGAAADVSIADAGDKITATTVEGALAELADAAGAKAVYMTNNTSTSGTDYAAIYKIYQGTGSAASPVGGELVGTINIPKDQFVDTAGLVDITYDDGKLYDGATDVTELIKGAGGTATAADAGKYVKLVFAVTSGSIAKSTIYISVKDLAHVYTGGANAEISVSVDTSTDVITATIVDVAANKITYIAADSTQGISRESVGAALARIDGDANTTGSISKKIADAIDGLDTSGDVAVATYTAGTSGAADVVSFTGSIKEEDGVIATGTGDTVTFSNITTAQINEIFNPVTP